MSMKHKWRLNTKITFSLDDGQEIIKTLPIAIPPTNGDRTDIIDTAGNYHYGMTKDEFMKRMTKEEYLEQTLPGLEGEDRETALKGIDWTPRLRNENIELIIEIKQGKITLKGK